jgi:hypothetical protein
MQDLFKETKFLKPTNGKSSKEDGLQSSSRTLKNPYLTYCNLRNLGTTVHISGFIYGCEFSSRRLFMTAG